MGLFFLNLNFLALHNRALKKLSRTIITHGIGVYFIRVFYGSWLTCFSYFLLSRAQTQMRQMRRARMMAASRPIDTPIAVDTPLEALDSDPLVQNCWESDNGA